MAKKTNKTDRVLNLLSNPEESAPGYKARPPVDPNPTTVEVVEAGEETKELSENIKNALEETLEAEQINKEAEVVNKAPSVQSTEKTGEAVKSETVAAPVDEAVNNEEMRNDVNTENNKNLPSFAKDIPLNKPDMLDVNSTHEFISVMEHVVCAMAPTLVKQLGGCSCSRCLADTIALALTNLPAKYVVAEKGQVSPLLNFYSRKYESEVTVQLTMACIRVQNFPHEHND